MAFKDTNYDLAESRYIDLILLILADSKFDELQEG